jgi:hypothetical protein
VKPARFLYAPVYLQNRQAIVLISEGTTFHSWWQAILGLPHPFLQERSNLDELTGLHQF